MIDRRTVLKCTLAIGGIVAFGFSNSVAQSTRPATQPAVPVGPDWPAFHGGGALTGLAQPIGPPPMKLRWTYRVDEMEAVPILGSAAIVGDAVYVADLAGKLHAINLASGKQIWTYTSKDSFETTPLIVDGKVVIGDAIGVVHAISITEGQPVWTFDAQNKIFGSANTLDGKIVFGTGGADIYCLNPSDGKPIWQMKAGDRINSAPAVTDSIFVSGCDAILRTYALADGKETSTIELKSLCPGSPAVVDGKVIVGVDEGVVQCFDLASKSLVWAFDGIGNKFTVYSSPAVAEGIVVVGARDRNVWALDLATGQKKWSFPTRGEVDSSPVISGGRVYIGSKDRRFYVLDLKTGEELWSFNAARAISAAPAIGRGAVVIPDEGGNVYCLEPAGQR